LESIVFFLVLDPAAFEDENEDEDEDDAEPVIVGCHVRIFPA
jgi:hypothetical protein